MSEKDQSALISDFVDGCKFERPFHLVCIDARGTVSVTRYDHNGIEQVCSGPAKANRFRLIAPLHVTCIGDGRGRSVKITVEAAGAAVTQ